MLLAWLANHLAEEGKGLHAGQIVLTGSLVKTVWLNAGDKRGDGARRARHGGGDFRD